MRTGDEVIEGVSGERGDGEGHERRGQDAAQSLEPRRQATGEARPEDQKPEREQPDAEVIGSKGRARADEHAKLFDEMARVGPDAQAQKVLDL